jgi:DNA polymerase/3'-5' exonuclease PolX
VATKPDGKYWRGLVDEQIKLDLFIAGADNFGIIYVIRTGSAEFTTALVTHAKRIGVPSVDGYLTRNGERLATPEERDVFNVLNLEYVEPEMRRGGRYLSIKE